MNYKTKTTISEDHTTIKILEQLKRTESELEKDLYKINRNEQMIKDKSYTNIININPKNINLEKKKLELELKHISENKKVYLSRLNEIKYRINSLQDKYIKDNGSYNLNCKENLNTFLQNQINKKNNVRINVRLKKLSVQNNKLLSNMKNDAKNKLNERQAQINEKEKNENEKNLKLLEKIRTEEKNEILKRKSNANEEIKKMEEYISGKPEIKKYLYQKLNKNFDLNLKKKYVAENKKRKKRIEPMELANIIQFEKNYEVQKVKKNLELEQKYQGLKKSWSERELLIPKYKSEISQLIDEEEKNKIIEKKMLNEKKNAMKFKQINYSKKFEDDLIMVNNQNNLYKSNVMDKTIKNKINKEYKSYTNNIKFHSINNYCDLIRKKILTKKASESKINTNIKLNHIDLTKNQNSTNKLKTPNLKLPSLLINNLPQNSNYETDIINNPKLQKNIHNNKLAEKEIQNFIDKNGINQATIEMVNSKLQNLKIKKEQKDLVLKYQGGITNNPDLGEEVCDILIDSMKAKMTLMDEMKKYIKGGNKNLVDQGTGNNAIENEVNQEEYEEEEEVEG